MVLKDISVLEYLKGLGKEKIISGDDTANCRKQLCIMVGNESLISRQEKDYIKKSLLKQPLWYYHLIKIRPVKHSMLQVGEIFSTKY